MEGQQLPQLAQNRQGWVGKVGEPVLAPVAQQTCYHLHYGMLMHQKQEDLTKI